jgi:hypothetical protein
MLNKMRFDRSQLKRRNSKAAPLIALPGREQKTVSFLSFQIGRYKLAIEAEMVASLGGHELKELLSVDEEKAFLPKHALVFPLAEELGEAAPPGREFIIAKGGPKGEKVLIMIDEIDRLLHISLQNLRPLPPVTKESIKVPFLWGMAIVEASIISLVDPESLYQYALRSKQQ